MAEGIKISEMEQVATLEDGCCFPVVSNGENKKITQKNLYSLMTTNLQNQINSINGESIFKLKTNRTSGRTLGFEPNSTVSVYDFWVTLFNNYKCANNVNLANACLDISWSGGEQCYITDGRTNVLFNSGSLIFTSSLPNTWGSFTALYLNGTSHKYFVISCYIGDSMNDINSHIREISTDNEIANLQNQINSINEESNFKLKTNRTSGRALGFGTNATVPVYDFWSALFNTFKCDNVNLANACLDVSWSGADQCYITDGNTNVLFNGGSLIFTGSMPNPWGNFTALYLNGINQKYFVISCSIGDSMNAISSHIREISTANEIANLQNQINNLSNSVPAKGLSKESANVMDAAGSIDFNTNKAVLQLPIYSKDATNQPTAAGAIWIQEVEVTE